jgi:hypothetical protein
MWKLLAKSRLLSGSLLTALIAAAALVVYSCATGAIHGTSAVPPVDANPAQKEQRLAELLAADFKEGMATCQLVKVDSPDTRHFTLNPRLGVGKTDLSEAEHELLGYHILSWKWPASWSDTPSRVARFYRANGKLPANGVELFPELLTQQGYDAFMAMSSRDRFEKYYSGVNFATGRFHAGFDYNTWTPGGIGIRPVASRGIQFGNIHISLANQLRDQSAVVCEYKLFGLQRDEVLVTNLVSVSATPPPSVPGAHNDTDVTVKFKPCDCGEGAAPPAQAGK